MSKTKSETVNYLLLYEAMVRHQDLEFDATHDHISLTIKRIQRLGRKSASNNNNNNIKNENAAAEEENEDGAPPGMLTYLQMRRCLLRLGYTWNRSLLPARDAGAASVGGGSNFGGASQGGGPRLYHDYDDDVSVASTTSATSYHSGGGLSSSSNTTGGLGSARDIIATDAQLIMLLTTLVEMEEKDRAARLAKREEEEDGDDGEEEGKDGEEGPAAGLYPPEFVQAYKLIIGGMQSLQTFPEGDGQALQDSRTRARERTLGLLKLFGPDSSLYKEDPYAVLVRRQPAGEGSTADDKKRGGKKSSRDGLGQSPNRNKKLSSKFKSKNTRKAKDGLAPRLSEDEIRSLVHSKDAALAKIMEDHETELNVMANNMEELRKKALRTQKMVKKRRRRTMVAALIFAVALACGGAYYEYLKREQVKMEIATGREAERTADAAVIKSLKDEIKALKSKLNDAEATVRYEEARHATVSEKYDKATKTLEESERRWRSESKELERCRITRKELDAELTSARARNEDVEEEVNWCRERLEGAERAMEGMERALKKNKKGGEVKMDVPSFKEITKDMDVVTDVAERMGLEVEKKKGGKYKPVAMEMKYNKSFRNAVILRQIYSAVAGMAVSFLFPGAKIVKLFIK